jgi:hypothetical protein
VQEGQQTTPEKKNKKKADGAVPGGIGKFFPEKGGTSGAALAGILITESSSSKKMCKPFRRQNLQVQ